MKTVSLGLFHLRLVNLSDVWKAYFRGELSTLTYGVECRRLLYLLACSYFGEVNVLVCTLFISFFMYMYYIFFM